jgi:hypothetical protein
MIFSTPLQTDFRSGAIDPSSLEFMMGYPCPSPYRAGIKRHSNFAPSKICTLGGEERATGVYIYIHDCRERRSQQRVKPKCEGYINRTLAHLMIRCLSKEPL